MPKTTANYFKERFRKSKDFHLWQDIVVAVIAVFIGYSILERKAAWENLIAVLCIGLGATLIFEIAKITWRFIWTVPRAADIALDNLLDRQIPKFAVTDVIPQRTETEDPTTMSLYVQIVTECLTDVRVYECRGHLLRVLKRNKDFEEWVPTGMSSALFLDWDYYGSVPFLLEPGIKRRINVCWWGEKTMFIVPAVQPLPSKFRTIFNSTGTFKFDIRVTAKDCAPVDASVTVNLDKRIWDKPTIRLQSA